MKEDLIAAMRHFFDTNHLLPQWKSTFITLVPKIKGPRMAKNFWPISLCNVYYKIVSEILVNRLKGVMPCIVSQEQSAFMSDRSIMDNVLDQEVLHSIGNRVKGKKLVMLKLDMERACDIMRWDFIKLVMGKFGFNEKFVSLIMGVSQNFHLPC